MADEEKYVCPNGHPVPREIPALCKECTSKVVYVVKAVEIELLEKLIEGPLLMLVFEGLRVRGWDSDVKGLWRNPKMPGEGFNVEGAIHAQCMIEITEIATDIKEEFGFNAEPQG